MNINVLPCVAILTTFINLLLLAFSIFILLIFIIKLFDFLDFCLKISQNVPNKFKESIDIKFMEGDFFVSPALLFDEFFIACEEVSILEINNQGGVILENTQIIVSDLLFFKCTCCRVTE